MQDDQVADLAGTEQQWGQWQEQFGLANGDDDIGYGHTSEQVDAIRIAEPSPAGRLPRRRARHDERLPRAGSTTPSSTGSSTSRWDPPVTAGRRLVSIIGDCLQHLGQVGYVKGLLRT